MPKVTKLDDEIPPIGPPILVRPPEDGMTIPDILEWIEYETRFGGELSADMTARLKNELRKYGGEPTQREPPCPPSPPPTMAPQKVDE